MSKAMFLSSRSLELSWRKDKKQKQNKTKNKKTGTGRTVSLAEEILGYMSHKSIRNSQMF